MLVYFFCHTHTHTQVARHNPGGSVHTILSFTIAGRLTFARPHSCSVGEVIEVGLRGHTNRWAHMLPARFIRLSGLRSQHFVTVCVCIPALYRTGEELICLISFLITYGPNSIRPRLSECHPPTYTPLRLSLRNVSVHKPLPVYLIFPSNKSTISCKGFFLLPVLTTRGTTPCSLIAQI